jgi:hypothetical protein
LKGENMKIKDIIIELEKYNGEEQLLIYTEGKIYPSVEIQEYENEISINGGWKEIKDSE